MVTRNEGKNHKAASSAPKGQGKPALRKSVDSLTSRTNLPKKVTSLSAAKAASIVLKSSKSAPKLKLADDDALSPNRK